jgi:hypothetical protein
MALHQDYAVDAAELSTPLSGLKCEVVLPHADALSCPLSFNGFAVFVTVDCCFWWEKFTQQEAFKIP